MALSRMPQNSDSLFAIVEDLANVLADNTHAALRIEPLAEARLRSSLAAAVYARTVYQAIHEAAGNSPVALSFLEEAKKRCVRTEVALQRLADQLISQLMMQMDPDDSPDLADYVLSLSF